MKLDGATVPHEYDAQKGRITLRGPFAKGEHAVEVVLLNVNKNHSWPRRISFDVQ